VALIQSFILEMMAHMGVVGDLWDAHPGHEAPVPPHPKDALLG